MAATGEVRQDKLNRKPLPTPELAEMPEDLHDRPAVPVAEEPAPLGAGIDFSDPNSPLAPFYLRTTHILAIALLGIVFVLVSHVPLWHTDVWGHLRYGQWMVEHRAIPDREPFCPWWDGRIPFSQFYTLTQLAMYETYAFGERIAGGDDLHRMMGGVEFLRMLHAGLTTAKLTVLLFVFLRLSGSWRIALLALAAVVIFDFLTWFVFRPQTFAQLGFALLLLPLSRPVLSKRAVAIIPAGLVLWANGHGSYVVAFALFAAVLLGRLIEVALDPKTRFTPWNDPQVVRLAMVLALSVVGVGLLNPYGFDLYSRTLQFATHPSLQGGVGEWKPLSFLWGWGKDSDAGLHWIFIASLLGIVLTQVASRQAIPPHRLVVLLMFGLGLALQQRFAIWWAMIVPWVLVPLWTDLAKHWPAKWTPAPSVPSFRKTAVAFVLLFALFMWSGPAGWFITGGPTALSAVPDNPQQPFSLSPGTPWELAREVRRPGSSDAPWAKAMTDIMKRSYPEGKFTGTIMATPMQGDYLMWALAPDVPVTYSHMHLFHPDYWTELGIVGRGEPGWSDVLEKYRVNLIVVEAQYGPRLRQQLQKTKGWTILLDETDDAVKKPIALTRQLIAIRNDPL